jgi:uncharacterized protein (TIGR00369 family)
MPTTSFIPELGFIASIGSEAAMGEARLVPEMMTPSGAVHGSVLVTFADILVGSLTNLVCAPRVCMSVDLDVRMLRPIGVEALRAEASILKSGRTTTVGEARFFDTRGDVVAVSLGTFMASPRPQDVLEVPPQIFRDEGRPLAQHLTDRLRIRQPEAGMAELDRWPDALNLAGTLQGGAVAHLAEVAALSLCEGTPTTAALDVRYLSATRVGPAQARAERLSDRVVRVELRDAGNADRPVAVAVHHI